MKIALRKSRLLMLSVTISALGLAGVFVLAPGAEAVDVTMQGAGPYNVTVVLPYMFDSVHQDVQEIQFNVGIYNKATPADIIGYAVVNAPFDPATSNGRVVGTLDVGINLIPGSMRQDIGNLSITTWFRKKDAEGRWMHYQPTTANDTNYPWLRVHEASVTTINTPLEPLIAPAQ